MSVPVVNAINPNSLVQLVDQLHQFVVRAASTGLTVKVVEESVLTAVVTVGRVAMSLFLALQGDGNLGETLVVEGEVLSRSDAPRERPVRTLFGEHSFSGYVYGRHLDRKIDFRPIDVRIQLPEGKYSPKFVEVAHLLDAEQAFGQAAKTLAAIFGPRLSVHSLERISEALGPAAEEFLYQVPIPTARDEGEILVVTADGKGVPMIREESPRVPAFEKREYPGNRKMATLAAVDSVDRFVRTPEQIVDALFRETEDAPAPKRPEPVGKVVVGCLTRVDAEGQPLPGDLQAFAWAAEQVERRHQAEQPLVRLMDGQVSLWETANVALEGRATIDILDLIHVSGYVWTAAKVFYPHREAQEWFTRDRLTRILNGEVSGVISGLRQMATKNRLSKPDRATVERVCRYFEKNRPRMRYDDYLREGYPIATGVIEGACRHLVMDRMCRTGMRWSPAGAQAMLQLRAIYQADQTKAFHDYRADREREKTAKFRHLLKDYESHNLCG